MRVLKTIWSATAVVLLLSACASAGTYHYEFFRADNAYRTVGTGINNDGVVSGSAYRDNTGREAKGFVRNSDGAISLTSFPGAFKTEFVGNNNLGQSLGIRRSANDSVGFIREADGSLRDIGFFQSLTDINDQGEALGIHGGDMFIRRASGEEDFLLSTGEYLWPAGLNNHGVVTYGYEFEFDFSSHIYDTVKHTGVTVEYPGATRTSVAGINNLGQVVGGATGPAGETIAYLRHADGTFEELLPPSRFGAFSVTDINDRGQFTGSFRRATESVFYGYIATPVPEPSSLLLMSACAVAGIASKRRSRAASSE